ncbi:MAG TPA: 5-oxoprolinase subunit PxpA [Actinomycetota bacterium]|nr:5-oxoprolinase subunit PxpA [Actinomycetota bacterium]
MEGRIDLNADLGEGSESDDELMRIVTSASIACGGHAGDAVTMAAAVESALAQGVRIGAHPSYPDRANFGRVSMYIDPQALVDSLIAQVDALSAIASDRDSSIAYIKPHGALYNDALTSAQIASVVAELARRRPLPLMTMPASAVTSVEGIEVILEGFADRAYSKEGMLMSRTVAGSVIREPDVAAEQAVLLAGSVDSVCIHSDTPNAVKIARVVRDRLAREGFEVSASSQ